LPVSGVSIIGRNTQGVKLMVTETEERIVAVAKLAEKEEGDDVDDDLIEEDAPVGESEE
jgi:DNA gyrase subunit A